MRNDEHIKTIGDLRDFVNNFEDLPDHTIIDFEDSDGNQYYLDNIPLVQHGTITVIIN